MKTYLTESLSGLMTGPRIEARSFMDACYRCPEGFRVIGRLIEEIEAPELDWMNLN